MALSTRKREPRQAREGATVARKGVTGPSLFNRRGPARAFVLARPPDFRYQRARGFPPKVPSSVFYALGIS